MAVTINGSTGIVGPDGSAGTPAIQGADSNTGMFFPAADTVAIATGGTERVRADSAGNVGVGTSNPVVKLQVTTANSSALPPTSGTTPSTGELIRLRTSADAAGGIGTIGLATNQMWLQACDATSLGAYYQLLLNPNGGDVLLGRTTAGGTAALSIGRPANTATYIYQMKEGQAECTWGFKASTDSNMYIGSGSTAVGTFGVYLTNTGNSWNSLSDERKKTIVEPITNAAEKVSSLRAVIGYYNHDENQIRRPFLIAQDVQAVLPEAVNIQDPETGTLGMSYTDTIPLLVAAIKELKAEVDALKGAQA